MHCPKLLVNSGLINTSNYLIVETPQHIWPADGRQTRNSVANTKNKKITHSQNEFLQLQKKTTITYVASVSLRMLLIKLFGY